MPCYSRHLIERTSQRRSVCNERLIQFQGESEEIHLYLKQLKFHLSAEKERNAL